MEIANLTVQILIFLGLIWYACETLKIRKISQHIALYFAIELSRMPEEERELAFEIRQTELNDLANDLRQRGRKSWRKPASFALSLAGSALSSLNTTIGAALTTAASLIGFGGPSETHPGVYSYLFRAHGRWPGYY